MESNNNFNEKCLRELDIQGTKYKFYSLERLNDKRLKYLPYSIRVLLESAVRNCDGFNVTENDVEKILDWSETSKKEVEIPFKPARVILQDFTGVPAVVDFAAMRDVVKDLGKDPKVINPIIPSELVVDHSIQVDFTRNEDSIKRNEELEFVRNRERFQFLKWGQQNIQNFLIVPPGSGIIHQVNLEYLARVVFENDGVLYPDSLVGTDSHTTMINGLGVLGWGVGGIEAEAAMLGQTISMVLPEVIGVKLVGNLPDQCNATDLVLTLTELLRKRKVVGKFVEYFGPGIKELSLADRATIANMSPEYGATMGYFPIDQTTIDYLTQTGRSEKQITLVSQYLKNNCLFYEDNSDINYSGEIITLDLGTIVPCCAGPKRPQDRVPLSDVKKDFEMALSSKLGFKGFGVKQEDLSASCEVIYEGQKYTLEHGSIVIAAITSCTNTSNPEVMLSAGLLAKKALEKGLNVKKYIKTSLSPGSGVVTKYLEISNLLEPLRSLGFALAGYGCMTCIGNSGDLEKVVSDQISSKDLVSVSVLSGNRNFEGRVHNLVKANYLASPPLVVAYALAGNVRINFETEPIGKDSVGNDVYLKDIWPSKKEISALIQECVKPKLFEEVYNKISKGTDNWNNLLVTNNVIYEWDEKSTYIKKPPFFEEMYKTSSSNDKNIMKARCLLMFGDSITTDHISPAGNISKTSSAAKYLTTNGVDIKDFNSYGARRGNFEVMARGTFANVRLINKLIKELGPKTIHFPTNQILDIYDVSTLYKNENIPLIILAGKEYGSGSSRDWAAKGPMLLGVRCVIAESYERIHRSNLVGMGILPLEFLNGENAENLGLNGSEEFTIEIENNLHLGNKIRVRAGEKDFFTKLRLDTAPEIEYFKNNGILLYVLKKLIK